MSVDAILTKDLLYNDILNKFEPLDQTETLAVELLSLPTNSYKYIQLTGLPLNPNYAESFNVEVKRTSDNFLFSETSQPEDIQPTQFWVNYHEQNPQQNGRIYFHNSVVAGTQFTIRYPFVGTASNYRNIYALAERQLYELLRTSGSLNAGNYKIINLANGTSTNHAINKGQLDSVNTTLTDSLYTEITNRTNGDSGLQTQITTLNSWKISTRQTYANTSISPGYIKITEIYVDAIIQDIGSGIMAITGYNLRIVISSNSGSVTKTIQI